MMKFVLLAFLLLGFEIQEGLSDVRYTCNDMALDCLCVEGCNGESYEWREGKCLTKDGYFM